MTELETAMAAAMATVGGDSNVANNKSCSERNGGGGDGDGDSNGNSDSNSRRRRWQQHNGGGDNLSDHFTRGGDNKMKVM